MAENPIHALKAIMSGETGIRGKTLYPLTIKRYAFLEEIDSPFLNDLKPENAKNTEYVLKMINSVYVLTADDVTLDGYRHSDVEKMKTDAMKWAVKNTKWLNENLGEIVKRVYDDISTVYYMVPEGKNSGSEENKPAKKIRTSNGWMMQMIYTMTKDFGFTVKYVLNAPLAELMMLMRQKTYNDLKGECWTLEDKESMDMIDKATEKQ